MISKTKLKAQLVFLPLVDIPKESISRIFPRWRPYASRSSKHSLLQCNLVRQVLWSLLEFSAVKNNCIIQQSEQQGINLGTISNYDFDNMFDPPSMATKSCINRRWFYLFSFILIGAGYLLPYSHNKKGKGPAPESPRYDGTKYPFRPVQLIEDHCIVGKSVLDLILFLYTSRTSLSIPFDLRTLWNLG